MRCSEFVGLFGLIIRINETESTDVQMATKRETNQSLTSSTNQLMDFESARGNVYQNQETSRERDIWVFPKIGVPQNVWFIMENFIKMDDLGGKTPYFWKHPFYSSSVFFSPPFRASIFSV